MTQGFGARMLVRARLVPDGHFAGRGDRGSVRFDVGLRRRHEFAHRRLLGDAIEVFIRRADAERFIEEVRGDEPELAVGLRIEERELEAGCTQLRPRLRVVLLALMLGVMIVANPGAVVVSAGPTWAPAMLLPFPNAGVSTPAVAVNSSGAALVTWDVATPESCREPACTHTLMATLRETADGAWTPPEPLAQSVFPVNAGVRLDAAGVGTVALLEYPQVGDVRVCVLSVDDGKWSAPVTLADESSVLGLRLVVNDAGDAVVIWHNTSVLSSPWEASYKPGPTAKWEAPAVIATGAGSYMGIGMDAAGNVRALSTFSTNDGTFIRSVSRSSSSQTWTAPTTIAKTEGAVAWLALAENARGDSVAAWVTGVSQQLFVESIYRKAGGRWTKSEALSRRAEDVVYLSVVIDRAGNALAAWTEEPVQFSRSSWTSFRRAAEGHWAPEVALGKSGQIPRLAIGPSGDAVAVWSDTPWTGNGVRASLWPAKLGAWTPVVRLGANDLGGLGGLGLDGHGRALAAWADSRTGVSSVEAAKLVPNGPLLTNLRVPKRGSRGVPLTFRVTPMPWGSRLRGAPTWMFGDGEGSRGFAVTHVFRRPGRFEVSVTQVDDAGGKSRVTERVTVHR